MKKTLKRVSALLLAIGMVFALSACKDSGEKNTGSPAPTGQNQTDESSAPTGGTDTGDLPVLRVSLHPAYISTPVAYAIFNDMAKDYGFQMDVQVYASGAPQNEALGSGLWDVGVIGGAFVTSVNTYGAYVIGDFIDGRDGNAIFVRADSDIAKATGSNPTYPDILGSADTVRGKTLITNLGTTGHVQVQKWLEALGLTEDDIQIVQMDYAAGYQAFISGEGDILATIGPYSTKALIEHADDWVVAGGFISLDLMQYEDVVCSADALASKRDLLVSFLRMVMDANDEGLVDQFYPGLSDYSLKQSVIKLAAINSVAYEFALVECEKEEDVEAVKGILQTRIDNQINGGAFYPETTEAWQKAELITNGNVVALIVAGEKQADAVTALKALL